MRYDHLAGSTLAKGSVRMLRRHELKLLRDHLLRLDAASRHDRFHGFLGDSFIERYAERCASDGTVIIAYIENGVVRGAAELHPPEHSPDAQPEIAFSVERSLRRSGVGSILFRKLIAEARAKGYRSLRITTGSHNEAMRALAHKFGANLTFRHGESSGSIALEPLRQPEPASAAATGAIEAGRAVVDFNRAYWRMWLNMCGWRMESAGQVPERSAQARTFKYH